MSLVKGPFEIKVDADVLAGIEDLDFSYEVDTDSVDTVQGRSYDIAKSHKVSIVATFIETDVASLSVVLPQYHVANGGTLSTGETVASSAGAIDIVPGDCGDTSELGDIIITGCGANAGVLRVVDCVSEIESIAFEDSVRKVGVKLTGNSTGDEATVQMFAQGAVSIAS